MSDSYFDSFRFEERRNAADIRFAIVIREQHFWLDSPSSVDKLFDCHGVGLVARQEGNIDVLDVCHFGDILSVACDVDPQTVKSEDEAVIPSLGMEVLVAFRGVVGRNGFDGDVVGELENVTVGHYGAITEHIGTVLVGDELGVVI